ELEIATVVVPPIPGGFSALGLVATDVRRDYARTFYAALATTDPARVAAAYAAMEEEARAMLRRAGIPEARREISRAADCRYPRQAYELTVPVADGPITAGTLARVAADFHERHRQTYGHASADEPVQLVNLRVTATGRLAALDLARAAAPATDAGAREGSAATTRAVYFKETGLASCPVVPRTALTPGTVRQGPLVVESADTTIVVPPGWRLRAQAGGFVLLESA
ncbi:MAG TPA: hydantoinase/oxoprolinase family protein, partial [Candidatus Tectomicrobia bacterium]|nr:hydantoinase/oxoprolinase family protein [Candidatus Tectomicrobia bacterium]